jgi:hypothetical protein
MTEEIAKIAVEEFEKKADGSWVCVKNSDVTTNTQKVIRIAPGMLFKKGGTFLGLDVVEALEKMSARPKN